MLRLDGIVRELDPQFLGRIGAEFFFNGDRTAFVRASTTDLLEFLSDNLLWLSESIFLAHKETMVDCLPLLQKTNSVLEIDACTPTGELHLLLFTKYENANILQPVFDMILEFLRKNRTLHLEVSGFNLQPFSSRQFETFTRQNKSLRSVILRHIHLESACCRVLSNISCSFVLQQSHGLYFCGGHERKAIIESEQIQL
jgi:hypothetical protein